MHLVWGGTHCKNIGHTTSRSREQLEHMHFIDIRAYYPRQLVLSLRFLFLGPFVPARTLASASPVRAMRAVVTTTTHAVSPGD